MDQDDAASLETGATGGLLRDLGSHLVDQMSWLLGPATHVYAAFDWTDRFGEATDCGFYTEFARAIRDGEPGRVPAGEGVRTLEVLDAARRSAAENRVVEL